MLFILKKIVSSLILPPTCLALLAFLGLWLSRKHPKAGKTLIALSATTLIILSLPITGNALLQRLEALPPISETDLHKIQAIVVLGGGKNNQAPEYGFTDTVSSTSLERIRYAAYLQQMVDVPIIVTGGAPFGGRTEAEAMSEALLRDFHAKHVVVERLSNDTADNARNTAHLLNELGISRIALISQAWHLPRAAYAFERAGLAVYPAPTGFTRPEPELISLWLPQAGALDRSCTAIKEWLGVLAQLMKTS